MALTPVRVAVVGLGAWGECHVETLASLPQAELVAVCDARVQHARQVAARWNCAALAVEELWARDDVDLVSIATPAPQHLEAVLATLGAGKHVLIEKPVALRADDARQMQSAARAHNKLLVPGHILRFDARYAEVKRRLDAGEIGAPLGLFSRRARPQWQLVIHGETHTALVLMAHDIDIALWWSGSRVKSVRAHERFVAPEKRVTPGSAPDLLWANLEFENGLFAALHSSWLLPQAAGIERDDDAEIVGENGVLRLQARDCGVEQWSDAGATKGRTMPDLALHTPLAGQLTGALREQLGYLCNCIARDETPLHVSFDDAIHGLEVAEAIIVSAQTRQEIQLS